MSGKPKASPRELQPGDPVLTITGRAAVVTRVNEQLREATVKRTDDAELVHFRQKHLKRSET